jgi:hypothetical protein
MICNVKKTYGKTGNVGFTFNRNYEVKIIGYKPKGGSLEPKEKIWNTKFRLMLRMQFAFVKVFKFWAVYFIIFGIGSNSGE